MECAVIVQTLVPVKSGDLPDACAIDNVRFESSPAIDAGSGNLVAELVEWAFCPSIRDGENLLVNPVQAENGETVHGNL